MFNATTVHKNISWCSYLVIQTRLKTKTHWAKLKRKTSPKYKALDHFDDFYGSVFGPKWEPMREAMLRRNKYVAVVNNYGNTEETMDYLINRGAHCLKNLISIQNDFHKEFQPKVEKSGEMKSTEEKSDKKLETFASRLQSEDIASVYPQKDSAPTRLDLADISLNSRESLMLSTEETKTPANATLDKSIEEATIDTSRIIDPSLGLTSESLYQYIPATKLKGMDDWLPESLHYSFYTKGKDFPLVIEPETEMTFPEHLKVYTYEMDSEWSMFPEPRRCNTGVFNYYPMDCGSVLSVLALCLQPGDRVLDLCSAPGGKALVALQTLLPDLLVCNDVSISRTNRQKHTFRNYLSDFDNNAKWLERVSFTRVDGRRFTDDQGFDKVLVDVPCTTDRHSITEDENNIFRPDRIKERLRLPELQAQLLANALRLVRVGGAVVYSTCALSPVQNDGPVHLALKMAFEQDSVVAVVKDLTPAFSGLSSTLRLCAGDSAPQYGQLVTPSTEANFGPSYIARLVRVK
ncbi:5-methylcytosine rRNA methyltransferase NSUN4 [Plodia interpunctella]|uniref:5-methylcytosine rRNA methyltransferase NSUN4 n=1 Tax=Plodia interpunctella TaxID=58824 RepID=UPI002367C095|nr:5-methylcytosine rRNA methyltransferase NSUN4 [Plodia interpunctella]XP_053610283.1 5-methylcytosine rRNA methyltransferase NSUN4 [Plodia interpunctella]XP_053610284.1 5-methylcytosine rRNA methyltransferase NSUN4 [Plodia interpunctella]